MAADSKTTEPDREPVWRVCGATATGASHTANGRPPEDALGVRPSTSLDRAESLVAVAASDGHGHSRHFRSARGAELAVEIATRIGLEVAAVARVLPDANAVDRLWRAKAGPELVAAWRAAVEKDVTENPLTGAEREAGGLREDSTIDQIIYGYGATLILVAAAGPWLLSAQIGDGDLFSISETGAVAALVASDPRLDGSRTTSLCQMDAVSSFRFGVAGVAGSTMAAVMMSTDGFGNAQARDDWEIAFGRDITGLIAANGEAWIAEQLPRWASKCASFDGSGDDVTVALMFRDGVTWRTPDAELTSPDVAAAPDTTVVAPAGASRSEAPTVPVAAAPAPGVAASPTGAASQGAAAPPAGPAAAAPVAQPAAAPTMQIATASAATVAVATAPAAIVAQPVAAEAVASPAEDDETEIAPRRDHPAGRPPTSARFAMVWVSGFLTAALVALGVLAYELTR